MFEAFVTYADEALQHRPVPGLALGVAQDGQLCHVFERGLRNLEEGLPATIGSRFGIGSITKSFTALAIMQLAEAGRLAVEDPVTRYLPGLRFPGAEQVTLHHLLTHTSGLPMLGTERYSASGMPEGEAPLPPLGVRQRTHIDSTVDLIDFLGEIDFRLIAPPGAVMSYSNDGFALLGGVVAQVSGQSYCDYIQEHILTPLGLGQTFYGPFGQVGAGTRRYILKPGDGPAVFEPGPDALGAMPMVGAGGGPQLSTVADLLRYLEVYRNNGVVDGHRLLSAAGIRRMTTAHVPVLPGSFYGYGLSIDQRFAGVTLISHGGGDLGVSAFVALAVEHGVTVAAQCNVNTNLIADLAHAALHALRGAAPDLTADPPAIACGPEYLERFVGTYASAGAKWRLWMEEGALQAQLGDKTYQAVPVAGDAIRVEVAPTNTVMITLAADATGKVYGIRTWSRVLPPAEA